MAHLHSDDIDLKLNRLRDMRRCGEPLLSDGEAIRLLHSTQDAFHALICARDNEKIAPKSRQPQQS